MTDTPETTDSPAAPAAAAPEAKAPDTIAASPPAAEPTARTSAPAPKAARPAGKTKAGADEPAAEEGKPARAAEADSKTVLDEEKPAPAEPEEWPSDWRERLAGDDAKKLGVLKRFASPKTFMESFFATKQKLSSGEYLKALPESPSDEDVADYRKAQGIPETPDGYDTALPGGLVIGEADKPLVGEFLTAMHGAHARPEAVKAALSAYYAIVERQQAAQQEADDAFWEQSQDALRAEWGQEFQRNKNAMLGLLDTAPSGVKEKLLTARTAYGKKVGADPDVLRFLTNLAREVNPAATVAPGAGANAAAAIADEIAGIERKMREDRQSYFKDEKLQARYRELVAARDKLASRAA